MRVPAYRGTRLSLHVSAERILSNAESNVISELDLGWSRKNVPLEPRKLLPRTSAIKKLYAGGATVRDARFGNYHKINRSIRPSNLPRYTGRNDLSFDTAHRVRYVSQFERRMTPRVTKLDLFSFHLPEDRAAETIFWRD